LYEWSLSPGTTEWPLRGEAQQGRPVAGGVSFANDHV
jgi:hypothetical protein